MDSLLELEIDRDSIYFIDIDGVMCRTHHYNIDLQMSREELIESKKLLVCEKDSVEFIKELNENKIEFYFLTGRTKLFEDSTEEMFKKAGLEFCIPNICYNSGYIFSTEDFLKHKIELVLERVPKDKKGKIIDDFPQLIEKINSLKLDNIEGILFSLPYLRYVGFDDEYCKLKALQEWYDDEQL